MNRKAKDLRFHGLYAITDAELGGTGIHHQVAQAIAGGARMIQYRDKGSDGARRRREATDILAVCRRHGVPMLVNDDIDLALQIGADGVHIGREDTGLIEARKQLGDDAIIGVSCYDRIDLARAACALGADYVAFGRFFSSRTKPAAVRAYPELLEQAREALECPVVAIGGITAQNGRALIDAGADMLAVIRGVFAATDITASARDISRLFNYSETNA